MNMKTRYHKYSACVHVQSLTSQ